MNTIYDAVKKAIQNYMEFYNEDTELTPREMQKLREPHDKFTYDPETISKMFEKEETENANA